MIVYKYLPAERIDILENSEIRFTQTCDLNDPFETLPNFSAYRDRVRSNLIAKRVERFGPAAANIGIGILDMMIDGTLSNFAETLSPHFGVLSLSRCRDNILMWSHYADNHSGFVVGFDSSNSFFDPVNGKTIDGLRPVIYSTERAVAPENGFQFSDEAERREANQSLFFTKSADWAYEQEMRILSDPSSADRRIVRENQTDICLLSFARDAVKEIVIGARLPTESLERFVELWQKTYSHAELYLASLNPTSFTVDVKPVTQAGLSIFNKLVAK